VQTLFPTEQKQQQTLLFAKAELVSFLKAKLLASAAELGDPSKEGEEELETREARVVAQVLRTLRLLVLKVPAAAADGGGNVAPEDGGKGAEGDMPAPLAESLDKVWSEEAAWERAFGAGTLSPQAHDAAFRLVSALSTRQPRMLQRHLATIAPRAFRAVALVDAGVQDSLWDMVLHIGQACPSAFRVPAVEANMLKWLQARARTGLLGPAAAGALLPLLAQMLRHGPDAWRSDTAARSLLYALGEGVASAAPDGRAACAAVYAEVLVFLARQRESKEEGSAGTLACAVLAAAMPGGAATALSAHGALLAEAICKGMSQPRNLDCKTHSR
jgi:hypothetical protein